MQGNLLCTFYGSAEPHFAEAEILDNQEVTLNLPALLIAYNYQVVVCGLEATIH